MISKKTLALLLLIALGISLGCAIKYYPQQQRLPSSALKEPRRSARSDKRETESTTVQSSSSKKESQRYAGYHTDLFRPLFDSPPPPKPEPDGQTLSAKAPPLPLPPPSIEPVKLLEPPVSRRLASFIYLGQVTDGENRSIFLKEKERIFVVKTGEDFGVKKEFRLAQVTEKEIRIAAKGRDELFRIPLEKKKPLKTDKTILPLARTGRKYPPPPLPDPSEG